MRALVFFFKKKPFSLKFSKSRTSSATQKKSVQRTSEKNKNKQKTPKKSYFLVGEVLARRFCPNPLSLLTSSMAFWASRCLLDVEQSQKCEYAIQSNDAVQMDAFCDWISAQNMLCDQTVLAKTIVYCFPMKPLVYAVHHGKQNAVDVLLLRGYDEWPNANAFGYVLIDDCQSLGRTSDRIAADDRFKQERLSRVRSELDELRNNISLYPDLWEIVQSYWTTLS